MIYLPVGDIDKNMSWLVLLWFIIISIDPCKICSVSSCIGACSNVVSVTVYVQSEQIK